MYEFSYSEIQLLDFLQMTLDQNMFCTKVIVLDEIYNLVVNFFIWDNLDP